jgi:hypothetical protein
MEKRLLELYNQFVELGKGLSSKPWTIIAATLNKEMNRNFSVSDYRKMMLTLLNKIGERNNDNSPQNISDSVPLNVIYSFKDEGWDPNSARENAAENMTHSFSETKYFDLSETINNGFSSDLDVFEVVNTTIQHAPNTPKRIRHSWTKEMEYSLLLHRYEILASGRKTIKQKEWESILMKLTTEFHRPFTVATCQMKITLIRAEFPHLKANTKKRCDLSLEKQLLQEFGERHLKNNFK